MHGKLKLFWKANPFPMYQRGILQCSGSINGAFLPVKTKSVFKYSIFFTQFLTRFMDYNISGFKNMQQIRMIVL